MGIKTVVLGEKFIILSNKRCNDLLIPNVIGAKYTLSDYYVFRKLKEINGGDINMLNGPDETLICGLMMGADGGIGATYNIMSNKYCDIYKISVVVKRYFSVDK